MGTAVEKSASNEKNLAAPGGTPGKEEALSDEVLVRQIQGGDEPAFEEIYRRFKDRAFSTAYSMTHDHSLAADVVQEIFIKLYRKLPKFKFQSIECYSIAAYRP